MTHHRINQTLPSHVNFDQEIAPEPPIAQTTERPEIEEVDPTVKKRAKNQSTEKTLKTKRSSSSLKKKQTESTGSKRQKKVDAKE